MMADRAVSAMRRRGLAMRCVRCVYIGDRMMMTKHTVMHHLSTDEVPFFCLVCGKKALKGEEISRHIMEKHAGMSPDTCVGGKKMAYILTDSDATTRTEETGALPAKVVKLPGGVEAVPVCKLNDELAKMYFALQSNPELLKQVHNAMEVQSAVASIEIPLSAFSEDTPIIVSEPAAVLPTPTGYQAMGAVQESTPAGIVEIESEPEDDDGTVPAVTLPVKPNLVHVPSSDEDVAIRSSPVSMGQNTNPYPSEQVSVDVPSEVPGPGQPSEELDNSICLDDIMADVLCSPPITPLPPTPKKIDVPPVVAPPVVVSSIVNPPVVAPAVDVSRVVDPPVVVPPVVAPPVPSTVKCQTESESAGKEQSVPVSTIAELIKTTVKETVEAVSDAIIVAARRQPLPPDQDLRPISNQLMATNLNLGQIAAQLKVAFTKSAETVDLLWDMSSNLASFRLEMTRLNRAVSCLTAAAQNIDQNLSVHNNLINTNLQGTLDSHATLTEAMRFQAGELIRTTGKVNEFIQGSRRRGQDSGLVDQILQLDNTTKPSVSTKPSTSAEPSISAEPSVSTKPSASTKPTVSAKPAVSAEPAVSAKPSVSAKPVENCKVKSVKTGVDQPSSHKSSSDNGNPVPATDRPKPQKDRPDFQAQDRSKPFQQYRPKSVVSRKRSLPENCSPDRGLKKQMAKIKREQEARFRQQRMFSKREL